MTGLALIGLLVVVALGRGGYAPWGTLALEVGAAVALVWVIFQLLWFYSPERDRRRRAWKMMPFHVRHPGLGRWLRLGRRTRADVEILLPGASEEEPVELDVGRNAYPLGVVWKRTGLTLPLALVTMWLLLSTVPLPPSVLDVLSPEASRSRAETSLLIGADAAPAPWSLAPFLTLRSFWLWIAVVSVLLQSAGAFRRPEVAASAALGLLIVGAASGALGVAEWISGLSSLWGRDLVALRASGSFGNPNHYAAFQAMLLCVSVGWLAYFRERHQPPSRRRRTDSGVLGRGAIGGLGVVVLCLGLLTSLSRAGLTFAVIGVAAWVLLTRRTGDRRPFAALGLIAFGFMVWFGLEPLLGRFENLEEQWLLEQGRTAVWRDSVPAVGDFWLTGSGLSSFRYVGAAYRSFGGRIFYSWAHNDYLQMAIELGAPGVLLLLWVGVVVIREIRRVREDLAGDSALLQLHSGFVAAIVAIALHSITDFSLHMPANLMLLAMVLGVSVGLEAKPHASSP